MHTQYDHGLVTITNGPACICQMSLHEGKSSPLHHVGLWGKDSRRTEKCPSLFHFLSGVSPGVLGYVKTFRENMVPSSL